MRKLEYSNFPASSSALSNHEWGRLIVAAVDNLNDLLAEAPSRDVTVCLEQKKHSIHEHPLLSITTLAENIR